MKISQITEVIERFAPLGWQESYDNAGLIVGRPDDEVHKALLAGELPLTMGGGIGQSRVSMILLGKAHVGEVQVSLWDDETMKICEEVGVMLL